MQKKLCAAALALLLSSSLYAQDELFLSLTKKSESLKNAPTSVSIVTAEQIKESGARNLAEAVEHATSVTSGSYGSLGATANIMLRGSSAEQVLVLVDGVRINDPAMGLVNLSTIPAETIERIEIIRGGVSALYGTSAFGGVVNLITKKPGEGGPAVALTASAGSFNTQQYGLNFGVNNDKMSGYFSAGKLTSDGWRENSGYDSNNIFARLGLADPLWGTFDLSGKQFSSAAGVPGRGVDLSRYDGSLEKYASTPDASQKENKSSVRLENTRQFSAGALKTVLHAADNKTDYLVPSWFKSDRYHSSVFGTEVQYAAVSGLTAGAEWWEELYKQTDRNTDSVMVDVSRVNSAGYVQLEAAYKNLRVVPSARLDSNSVFGAVVSPRMTVVFHAADSLKLSANAGKAWRAPTINELFWPADTSLFFGTTYITAGNAALVPEEGITADIGAEYQASRSKTSLTLFQTDSRNLISWNSAMNAAGTVITTMPENIGESRQQGAEFEFGQKIISGLSHKLNYTYLWAEDTQQHTQLIYRPQNTAQYELSWLFVTQTQATVAARFVGSQKTGDPVITELPEYTTVNCRISQKLKSTELWVGLDNVFDVMYQTRLYYPLPGQTITAGLTWKFQE